MSSHGSPPADGTPSPEAPAPARRRSRRVIAYVLSILFALCACAGFAVVMSLAQRFQDSNRMVVEHLQAHPVVRADIGQPMSQSWLIWSESRKRSGEVREFELEYSMSGPRGEGEVWVSGKESGNWYEIVQVSWTFRDRGQLLIPDEDGRTLRSPNHPDHDEAR